MIDSEKSAVDAVKRHLATASPGDGPVIVSVEGADWPDASLGWAEPDTFYAQVLTSGYRIVAMVGGVSWECRVSGDLVKCRKT